MSNPSGVAPPSSTFYPGYNQILVDDFLGDELNADVWGGFYDDPDGEFGPWLPDHGSVSDSIAQCSMYQDSSLEGDPFTGTGFSAGSEPSVFLANAGIAEVMMRRDGGYGITVAMGMISNSWPPEIDFYEDFPGDNNVNDMTVTAIWSDTPSRQQEQRNTATEGLTYDGTQWNIWGVQWNPRAITFSINRIPWTSFPNPNVDPTNPHNLTGVMKLFMQIETGDGAPTPETPPTPDVVNLQVDWVSLFAVDSLPRFINDSGRKRYFPT